MMIPIRTRTPKPTRELVTKEKNFQTLVEDWLVSNALAALNHHQHLKKPPLVSGNSEHIQVLVLHLDTVAAQEFSHDDTDHDTDRGRPSTYRLSLGKIYASNERRAKWVIEHWDRSKIERRSQGGKHGSHDGTARAQPPGSHMATSGRTGTFRHASGCQRRWLGRGWLGRG